LSVKQIFDSFKKSPAFAKLNRPATEIAVEHLAMDGIAGSGLNFFIAALAETQRSSHLVILPQREDAAYCFNDFQHLLEKFNVLYFPSTQKKPYTPDSSNQQQNLLRAEALNTINVSRKPFVVITYPEAITEKVITRKNLLKNTFKVTMGDSLSIDFLNEFMQEYDFERVDFVTEPGQFAIRGGIIDVFSYSDELPVRIELFGSEVDTIRAFDPVDQLSKRNHDFFHIIPNVQGKILKENRESLLSFLPAQTHVWIKDTDQCADSIESYFDDAKEAFQTAEEEQKHLKPEDRYLSKKQFLEELHQKNLVLVGKNKHIKTSEKIALHSSPQPSFSKNFNLISENIAALNKQGTECYVFSDNPKQIERVYHIFEDIGSQAKFVAMNFAIHEGFVILDLAIACYSDHQLFDRYHRYKLKDGHDRKTAITLREIKGLQHGDFVTHVDHGVGKFAGLESMEVNGKMQETVKLVYKDNDILYVSVHSLHRIAKYSGKEGTEPKLNKLGSNAWANLKQKTKSRVKDIAKDLIKLYAERKSKKGFAFSPDTYLQHELEASFIYEDTPDQNKATQDVKKDMEKHIPMDRLVCGDVGFGKTEVAIRAAFKAVGDSKQVAVLVPTTILASQHYKTFKERLKDLPCSVDYVNRFKSAKQQKETLEKLANGKVDIIVGTHRLLSKDVKFKDLGLIIVDEEQKFGVAAKERLKTIRVNVDTLTLTATPIPRTLHFSLMGARDFSVINTPPPNRYPVQTELHTFNEEIIKEAVAFEVNRGGQVFFVHNRVQNIKDIADLIMKLCPGVTVGIGHGQMDGNDLENVMLNFIDGAYDVLVATTIIESGLDIPNANTIIINNAHLFGLSDLHQMRGRVGRSNKKAFCYLLTQPLYLLPNDAQKRLRAIEEFSDIGSGFNIALRDLDIRGAGNLLGAEQSGFIAEIGFEMYHKILDEAVQELKETDFKDLFAEELKAKAAKQEYVQDCQIDTDLEILIPSSYVNSTAERLMLYRELDNIEDEYELNKFSDKLIDRFGKIPKATLQLLDTIRLRKMAKELGFEKIMLKQQMLIAYFTSNPQSAYYQSTSFAAVIKFLQTPQGRNAKMKDKNGRLSLSVSGVRTISEALGFFAHLKENIVEGSAVNVPTKT
jgi:transcription-repair coupling factor (superfamily II helicase)